MFYRLRNPPTADFTRGMLATIRSIAPRVLAYCLKMEISKNTGPLFSKKLNTTDRSEIYFE
jgi:hypothetical protein